MKKSLCHCDQNGKFEFLVVLLIEITLTLAYFLWIEQRDFVSLVFGFFPFSLLFPFRVFVNLLLPTGYTGAAAESMLGSLLCLPGSGSVLLDHCTGSTISETTSEAWSVEVLPSDSGQYAVTICILICTEVLNVRYSNFCMMDILSGIHLTSVKQLIAKTFKREFSEGIFCSSRKNAVLDGIG